MTVSNDDRWIADYFIECRDKARENFRTFRKNIDEMEKQKTNPAVCDYLKTISSMMETLDAQMEKYEIPTLSEWHNRVIPPTLCVMYDPAFLKDVADLSAGTMPQSIKEYFDRQMRRRRGMGDDDGKS